MRRILLFGVCILVATACSSPTKSSEGSTYVSTSETEKNQKTEVEEAQKTIPITTSSEEARKHYIAGRDLLERLRFLEAREELQKAVKADPTLAIAWLMLSTVQPSSKGFFEALEMAKKGTKEASEAERWWVEGVAAGTKGDTARQLELYQKIVAAYPKDERAQALLGNVHFGSQQYEKAIASYEKAKKIAPDFHAIYNQMGYAHRFMKQYEKAEKAFKKYIELLPDDPNPYDSYAELKLKLGHFEEAIASYRKALEVSPNFSSAHFGIATCLNLQEKHQEARAELQTLYAKAPDDGVRRGALLATATSYADQGMFDKAIDEISKASELSEKISDMNALSGDWITKGFIYLESRQNTQAQKAFDTALSTTLESDSSDDVKGVAKRQHRYQSARVAIAKNDLKKAEELASLFRKEVEALKNPIAIQSAYELDGLIAASKGKHETALDAFGQAGAQNPNVLYAKAMSLRKLDKEKEAQVLIKELNEFNALSFLGYSLVRWRMKKLADKGAVVQ